MYYPSIFFGNTGVFELKLARQKLEETYLFPLIQNKNFIECNDPNSQKFTEKEKDFH
jgi:hypothetical protein